MIASNLAKDSDIGEARLTCKAISEAISPLFRKRIIGDRTVYPTHASFQEFFTLLNLTDAMGSYVHKITLVTEGLKEHEYGYNWGWENLQNFEDLYFTSQDLDIINSTNQLHANEINLNGAFVNGGGYRTTLGLLLARLPRLQVIQVRKLRSGEHVPGWAGPELLKHLSFFQEDLKVNDIYYGNWKYDETHLRVTCHIDEFGDEYLEPGAGPQATFSEDLQAAVATSGTNAEIIEIV